MRITPLKTILKTKIVKEFLANKEHEKCVKFHGYSDIKDFFVKTYNDYKENGEDWGFEKLDTETLLYNIGCDMEAMYDDFRRKNNE